MASITVGSINESGTISGFDKQGFTPDKAVSELIANSCDAFSDNLHLNVDQSHIRMIEDGNGMDSEGIKNFLDLSRENHLNDKSMGVAGVGAKPSLFQLSKETHLSVPRDMHAYTRACRKDSLVYKIDIPWGNIKETGQYSGKFTVTEANQDETMEFYNYRKANGMKDSGLNIVFPYSTSFHDLLTEQFQEIHEDAINSNKLWKVIFGKKELKIILNDNKGCQPPNKL